MQPPNHPEQSRRRGMRRARLVTVALAGGSLVAAGALADLAAHDVSSTTKSSVVAQTSSGSSSTKSTTTGSTGSTATSSNSSSSYTSPTSSTTTPQVSSGAS